MTEHATSRIRERLEAAGWTTQDMDDIAHKLDTLASKCGRKSVAVCFARLGRQIGETYGALSNGDAAWAIVRDGRIVTCMLRRSNQPSTTQAMRVDVVLDLGI